jgi:hypothetical protein
MLVARCHSQILVTKQLGYSVNIRSSHSQPRCSSMPQIMKAEVLNSGSAA